MIKFDEKTILLLCAIVSLILIINQVLLNNPLKDINNSILEGLQGGPENNGKCEENTNQNYQFRSAVSSDAITSVKNFNCSEITDFKSCNSNINCIWKKPYTGINDNFSIIGIKKSSSQQNTDLANFGQIQIYNFFGGMLNEPEIIPNPDSSTHPGIQINGNLICPQLFLDDLYAIGIIKENDKLQAAIFSCTLNFSGQTVKFTKWNYIRNITGKNNEYIPSMLVLGKLSTDNHLYAGIVFKPTLQISFADLTNIKKNVVQVTIPYYTKPVTGIFFAMDYFYYIQDEPKNSLFQIDPNKPQVKPSAWSLFWGSLFNAILSKVMNAFHLQGLIFGIFNAITSIVHASGPDSESNISNIKSNGKNLNKAEIEKMAKKCTPPPKSDQIKFTWGVNARNFVFYQNDIYFSKGISELQHANVNEATADCSWRIIENPIDFSGSYHQLQTAATFQHLLYINESGNLSIWTIDSNKWSSFNSSLSSTSGACIYVPRMVDTIKKHKN